MQNRLMQFIVNFINSGITPEMDNQLKKRIRLTNKLAFWAGPLPLLLSVIAFYTGDYIAFYFNFMITSLWYIGVILNRAKMYYLARHTIIIGVAIVGGIEHQIAGPVVSINHGYFPWLFLPFILFEFRDRLHLIICTILIGSLFLLSEFYRFPIFIGHEAPLETALITKFFTSILFIFLISFMVYQFMKESFLSDSKLEEEMNKIQDLNNKLVEQQKTLVRASRMAALGEMANAMSHEINNPLAIIKMSSQQMMRLSDRDQLTEEAKSKSIKKLDEAVSRITDIIGSLRKFSSKKGNAIPEFSDLSVALENSLNLCRERFQEKEMRLYIQDLKHLRVQMETADLQHVLFNVLNNAIEHSIQESSEEKWISVKLEEQERHQVLLIENGGKPISQEVSERVFEPFFTTKDIGQGMGIGLSSSKGIMTAQGGDLNLNTSSGRTCFVLEFPRL